MLALENAPPIDLLLTDVVMPGVWTVSRWCRRRASNGLA